MILRGILVNNATLTTSGLAEVALKASRME